MRAICVESRTLNWKVYFKNSKRIRVQKKGKGKLKEKSGQVHTCVESRTLNWKVKRKSELSHNTNHARHDSIDSTKVKGATCFG